MAALLALAVEEVSRRDLHPVDVRQPVGGQADAGARVAELGQAVAYG